MILMWYMFEKDMDNEFLKPWPVHSCKALEQESLLTKTHLEDIKIFSFPEISRTRDFKIEVDKAHITVRQQLVYDNNVSNYFTAHKNFQIKPTISYIKCAG